MFGLLKSHRLVYEDRRDVGGGVTSLAFRARRPINARAGQHGFLHLGATVVKPFSLASAPGEGAVLIATSLASGSAAKNRLAALRPGDWLTLRGPINNFTLDGVAGPIVMLAQGVGITPFRSMLAHIALDDLALDSSLIHVARSGHAYRDDTEKWAAWSAYPQHSDEFRDAVTATARARPNARFYAAGASAFVSSTAALLRSCGIEAGNIRQDKYLGYRPTARRAVTSDP